MKVLLIIFGVLLLLAWIFVYLKFFREKGKSNGRTVLIEEPPIEEEGVPEEAGEKISGVTDGGTIVEKTYYVAPWGDDKSDGSLTTPWKTLQHAISNLGTGGSLLIREGTYRESVSLKQSGSSENPIIISVFQGEAAVLDRGGGGWKYGFNFEFGVSYVVLSGLKVKGFEGYGVALWGENRSIQLKDLEVLGCGAGLHIISATHLLVEGCNFHNNSGPGLVVSPGPLNTGRTVRTRSSYNREGFLLDSGAEIVIEKCSAENNTGSGFNCLTSGTAISASVARDNGQYGVKCTGEGYRLVNCIIDSSGMAGVALHGGGLYELFNNLVINCGLKGDFGLLVAPEAGPFPARVSLVNNIFAYNYSGLHFGSSAVLEKEGNNIYWSREDAEISTSNRRYSRREINEQVWFKETGRGERSFCRDPLFVDPSRHDFRLAKNSPAIDRGTSEDAPGADINGSVRPQGWGFDIGPYESAEGSLIPPTSWITHSPGYSSDSSDSLKFRVKWSGLVEGGEVTGFNVQFKDGAGGTWQNWLAETTESEGEFWGVSGRTYYFRVRAKDDLGNWGNWSDERYTVVPADDQSPLIKYEGDWDYINSEETFLNTLHHSVCPGAKASFRFTGTEVAWISTRGPDRGRATVYIDYAPQATIDLFSEDYQYRCPVFSASLDGKPHTISVEVADTRNERSGSHRVDIDGIAVKS